MSIYFFLDIYLFLDKMVDFMLEVMLYIIKNLNLIILIFIYGLFMLIWIEVNYNLFMELDCRFMIFILMVIKVF